MYRRLEKNLLNSNISSTCPHNIMNFCLVMAEINWRFWGTRANFNGFRVQGATYIRRAAITLGISPDSS